MSSKRRIMLMFEHVPCDVFVDVSVPLPEPIVEGAETMAARVLPQCPLRNKPSTYRGWSFDHEDGLA